MNMNVLNVIILQKICQILENIVKRGDIDKLNPGGLPKKGKTTPEPQKCTLNQNPSHPNRYKNIVIIMNVKNVI